MDGNRAVTNLPPAKRKQAMGLLFGVLLLLMQFLFSPLWGRLSDRIGRKPVLMLGLCGYIVGQTLWGISTSAWMLFAARTVAGMISAAALPTAMAYIADITSGEATVAFSGSGLLDAFDSLGRIAGPALGGALFDVNAVLPCISGGTLFVVTLALATAWAAWAGLLKARGEVAVDG